MRHKEKVILKEVEEQKPKAHLIGICLVKDSEKKQKSFEELKLLVKTMGLETVSVNLQKKEHPDKALYTGKGFIKAVVEAMEENDILIYDNDLRPSQIRNISKKFDIEIMDRSEVILEIFQQHAHTKEAKIQVNLARYQYELPRLRKLWGHLDREKGTASTGGIARGTGEKQLELDRRYVRQKISKARQDLKRIASQKEIQRQYRFSHFKKVCIVGYTNAGKSTMFNALTGGNVLVEDKLFATLESTSRSLNLGKGRDIIISDTIGFISQLPHHLVASFRATLQEINDADLLLHIIDASLNNYITRINDVVTVLTEIKCDNIPRKMVFNKIDLLSKNELMSLKEKYPDAVFISANKKSNLDFLLERVDEQLNMAHKFSFLIPHIEQKAISQMFELGDILKKEYRNDGVLMQVIINDEDLYMFEKWKV